MRPNCCLFQHVFQRRFCLTLQLGAGNLFSRRNLSACPVLREEWRRKGMREALLSGGCWLLITPVGNLTVPPFHISAWLGNVGESNRRLLPSDPLRMRISSIRLPLFSALKKLHRYNASFSTVKILESQENAYSLLYFDHSICMFPLASFVLYYSRWPS